MFPISLMLPSAFFAALSLTISADALQIQSLNPTTLGSKAASGRTRISTALRSSFTTARPIRRRTPTGQPTLAPLRPQQLNIFGDKCIDVKDGVNADGTKLQIWDCTEGDTNQQFVVLSNAGGLIQWVDEQVHRPDERRHDRQYAIANLDLRYRQHEPGRLPAIEPEWAPAQDVQSVTIAAQVSLNNVAGPFCIVGTSNTDGASVVIARCANSAFLGQFPNGNATWAAPLALTIGTITTFGESKCLDVKDGSTANGNRLQLWDCTEGDTNQQFTVGNSGSQIKWPGRASLRGAQIQIWDCDAADKDTNQQWFFQ
ncbi:hypothetical protein B0H13DRAFT_2480463 [Mycena leptocephala]|nr:hypothetical protein B0H13DRAFT_2480463 [Mycena leptocephala]